jgi:DNA-binding LytR/AlgR family response regulator
MNPAKTSITGQILATSEALLLPFRAGRRWVDFGQIVRLEGIGNYTTCFFADGSQLMVALTIKCLFDRMPASQFVRLHRKHLINRAFFEAIQPHNFMVLLSNGDAISIARRRAGTVMREFRAEPDPKPEKRVIKLTHN